MGRFADLCGEVASEADTGPEGLVLPEEALARLRDSGWVDEDIEDALEFVHATFVQNELIEAADALSAQLVDALSSFDDDARFQAAAAGRGGLSLDALRRLTRGVAHLERVLAPLREDAPVDLTHIDRLARRLVDEGLEAAMKPPRLSLPDR